MADKKDNYSDIPKCYREFYLSYTDNYEDSGFDKEYLEWLLNLLKNHPDDANLQDKDVQNNLGCIFENGIMVEKDIHKAVYWYERAISHSPNSQRPSGNLTGIASENLHSDWKKFFPNER